MNGQASRTKDQGLRTKDQGSRIKASGSRIKDQGAMTKDQGSWSFGTNEHPRRDTDVILRLSKFTIEDLSFHIGYVKESMVQMVAFDEHVTFV